MKYLLFSSALIAAPVAAQEAPRPDAAAVDTAVPSTANGNAASDVVVVANRAPVAADTVAASVTVLTRDEIDRTQDLAVSDILARTPGVTVSRNGGYGTVTSVRIRGAETDQTAVVIDGVKLNDPSAVGGGYDFGNLLIGDATRIEVLRGPQSTIWGSQAIGGVVSVTTPLPEAPLEGSFDVEAGSRDTVSARAAIGGRTGPLAFRIAGQTLTTDGISAIAPAFGGVERDGNTNRSATGRAVLDIVPGVSADLRGYYSRSRVDFDSSFGAPDTLEFGVNRQWIGYAGLNVALAEGRFRNRFAYNVGVTDHDNTDPASTYGGAKTFDAHGHTRRFEYQGSLALSDRWNAVFGAENERSRFSSISPQYETAATTGRAEITSVYGQLNLLPVDGLTLTGGVRHDDHSTFGGKTLFSGGGVWALTTGTVLRGTYSEGFKAPSLYQLYSSYGNGALRPESAHGFDAGVEQRFLDGRVSVGATYFERETRDLITFASTPPRADRPYGYYSNVARAHAEGIEAAGSVRLAEGLVADANYSWIASEDRSGGTADGNTLARRPRHVANGSIAYALPTGLLLGAAVRWSGESFEDGANTIRLAPYTLVDLRAELPVGGGVRVFGRVENLFDEEYQTAYRYGTLGRSFYMGLRGRF